MATDHQDVDSYFDIFESFNARNLDPPQVAKTFIPPSQFFDLVRRQHSVVIGPRGSGKTTLLKMLQVPALRAWHHPRAPEVREAIDYTSVFVPADVAWGKQLEALGGPYLPESTKELLGLSAFTHHVLISFVDAVMQVRDVTEENVFSCPKIDIHISREQEQQFVDVISPHWHIRPSVPSFLALKLALRSRLALIFEVAQLARVLGKDEVMRRFDTARLLGPSALQGVITGIEAFNGVIGNPYRKWALLFDELEIAPKSIRRVVLQALRSTDQRLLFKLSLSPFSREMAQLQDSTAPMPAQDYHQILLSYSRKSDNWPFSNALLAAMVEGSPNDDQLPFRVFGPSYVAGEEDEETESGAPTYRPGSYLHGCFVSLFAKDASFAAFIRGKGIDLSSIHMLPEATRASLIRKITPVVLVRETFRGADMHRRGVRNAAGRSRKNPDLYTGAQALFAIVEGNPRWFISIIAPLAQLHRESGYKRVPRPKQATAVRDATSRFRAFLKTLPYATTGGGEARGLLHFLDAIGRYFHREVVQNDFEPEPPLSFTVDSHTQPELEDAVEKAVHAGALVYVPDPRSSELLSSVRGKRFRLSYMLASHYRLPLRLGKSRSLSRVLRDSSQEELFDAGSR